MGVPDWASTIRPDEVAETWDGVYSSPVTGLYEALWALTPPTASYAENIEDIGPADVVGIDCLADVWTQLSEEHQAELIRLEAEQIWHRL